MYTPADVNRINMKSGLQSVVQHQGNVSSSSGSIPTKITNRQTRPALKGAQDLESVAKHKRYGIRPSGIHPRYSSQSSWRSKPAAAAHGLHRKAINRSSGKLSGTPITSRASCANASMICAAVEHWKLSLCPKDVRTMPSSAHCTEKSILTEVTVSPILYHVTSEVRIGQHPYASSYRTKPDT